MYWIVGLIVLAAVVFILLKFIQGRGIRRVANIASETTKKMSFRVKNPQNDAEPYSTWLHDSNPEQLFLRIMAHTGSNTKLRGELLAKLYGACKFISETIAVDGYASNVIQLGAIKFTDAFSGAEHDGVDLAELGTQRKNLISTVNQYFGDIKTVLTRAS